MKKCYDESSDDETDSDDECSNDEMECNNKQICRGRKVTNRTLDFADYSTYTYSSTPVFDSNCCEN